MHFELQEDGDDMVVSFASSKERFVLGRLKFVDEDGDVRRDVMQLMAVSVVDNPFFVVVKEN